MEPSESNERVSTRQRASINLYRVPWPRRLTRRPIRPIIGDRRPPSPLDSIQPDRWLPEYTNDLIDLLNVLGRLIALEPAQADLLDRICGGQLVSDETLRTAGIFGEREEAAEGPASA
jgi:hypothetical protein